MTDCPTCEYHKQRAQIWRDEAYRLAGHPLPRNEEYKTWWHNEGSGILPLPNEDMEEFAHRMTEIAWSNGAYKEREACAKIFDDANGTGRIASNRQAAEAIRTRGQA